MSGCLFSRSAGAERAVYDLGAVKTQCKVPVDVGNIRNASGADRRFFYRMKDNRIEFDSVNFWLNEPEEAVEKLLRNSFAAAKEDAVELSGVIDDFGFDMNKKLAVLTADFTLKRGKKSVNIRCSESSAFDGKSAASASRAMTDCASKLVAKLSGEVEKFSKTR